MGGNHIRQVSWNLLLVAFLSSACAADTSALDAVDLDRHKSDEPLRLENLARGSKLDLNGSVFTFAISRNPHPVKGRDCEIGNRAVNRYPLGIEDSRDVRVTGGVFRGLVSLASDWEWTYCNSAALRIEDSPGVVISGQRIDRAWDAIRIDGGTRNFTIENVWVTDTRDDCVENDELMPGTIRNSLFDGCFSGFSVAPTGRVERGARIEIDNVLLRLQEFRYKDERRHVMPIKMDGRTARFRITNSIFAVESRDPIGAQHAGALWSSIEDCSGNLLLWLGDGKPPREFSRLPDCFEFVGGQKARDIWNARKIEWINCYGTRNRLSSDPSPRPEECPREG